MNESDQKEPTGTIQTDAETHSEIVELIAHRRPREEARRNPRFPAQETLSGDFSSQAPFGLIMCDHQTAQEAGNNASPSDSNSSARGPWQRESLEIVSGFHVVDFSREGMQIQFACGNPLKYSTKQLYLEIEKFAIPVTMRWFCEHRGTLRAGVCFHKDIEHSPALSAILVKLCESLISFLTYRYIPDNTLQHREIAVFTYFCILYNLKLRYINALSVFNETNSILESFVLPNKQRHITTGSTKDYSYARYVQLHSTGKLMGTQEQKDTFDIFMKPYYEIGCGISGSEGRVVFLEKEIVDIVLNFLLSPEAETPQSNGFINQLQVVYECFTTLQELLPALFESEKFTQQFQYYSSVISSILLSREPLIDLISNMAHGQTSSGVTDARLPGRGGGFPDLSGVGENEAAGGRG